MTFYGFLYIIGCCTEYDMLGNVIQGNYKRNCSIFTHNPCPMLYMSTETFKCKYM